MLGKPKYTYGDKVRFLWPTAATYEDDHIEHHNEIIKEGVIGIVDRYGVFENKSDVHYDILVEDENTLYKHVIETKITEKIGNGTVPFGTPLHGGGNNAI